ncbi:MAG: GTP-binding protein [Pseudomonadota bacterium]
MTARVVPEAPIPVTVITGFLGSGKTTLLRHLLGQRELADAAVIVNEFGDVGLDHLLLERGDESTLLLDSGCLCCTLQGDLVTTLQSLLDRRVRGEIPAFSRVMIETTGLADPGALIRMFWSDPLRLSRYTFDRTITCIDAVAGVASLAKSREARRQVAFADVLVVTKTDLSTADAVIAEVFAVNAEAIIVTATMGNVPVDVLLAMHGRAEAPGLDGDSAPSTHRLSDIVTVSCTHHEAVAWDRLEHGLAELIARFGADLLRLKGLILVDEVDGLVRIDAVQGCFHRPAVTDMPSHEDGASHVVAIAQSVDEVQLRRDLKSLFDLSAEQVLHTA